jgi:PAS domain S-box-containing protein
MFAVIQWSTTALGKAEASRGIEMTVRAPDRGQVNSSLSNRARKSASSLQEVGSNASASGRVQLQQLKRQIKHLLKEKRAVEIDRESIQQECERYRTLYDSALAGCVVTNAHGKIVEANAAARELLGGDRSKRLIGAMIERFISPKDRPRLRELLTTGVGVGGDVHCQPVRLAASDAEKRSILVSLVAANRTRPRQVRWLLQPNRSQGDGSTISGLFANEHEMLAAIVENCDDAIIGMSLNSQVFAWNNAAERLFGYTPHEMIGQSISKVIPRDRQSEEKHILGRIRRGEQLRQYRTVRIDRMGRPIDVSLTVSPIRNDRGEVIGVSKIIHDITEQRRAEQALRESESRFRVAYEHAPIGIEQVDVRSGKLLEVNAKLCGILGYSRDELLHKTFAEITDPSDLKVERRLLKDLTAGRVSSYTLEKRYINRNHEPVWVRVTSAKAGLSGEHPYRITVVQDIREHKAAEQSLRDSAERMRAIVDTAVDAIITIDERGIIESANLATERLFGYQAKELIGRNIKMLMPDPYQSEHDTYLRNYVTTGEAKIIGIGREVIALRKDRTTFPINLSVSEVQLGNRRLFTGIIHDISQRRNLEKQILEISEAEQRRIGQDLHDGLCQYLVGIGFSAEMIAARIGQQSPEQADEVRKIGQLMRNAATQARDLSHGLNPVGIGEQGLATALATLARQISELFQVACSFESAGSPNVSDRAAAMHIYRIAQEAVSNSVRHGHAQEIAITLKSAKSYLVLAIEDNGRGIKDAGRTGMGLKTMSYRARMIGGNLQIGPRAGGGTIVKCGIPIAS